MAALTIPPKRSNHYGCTMASITLKALSPSLHRALKARATRHKRSLNQEAIAILEAATAPAGKVDVEAMLAEDRRLRQRFHLTTTPEEIDAFRREGRG
jgi:antitoxin FitA